MNEQTSALFKTLTELPGASGYEHEVRRFVRGELRKYTAEIVQDRLGSIFGVFRGDVQGPKIMVNGHMDEVGFMITRIHDNGMLGFQPLGGWWNQVLLAQRMHVITANGPLPGVIGSTPRHLLSEAERNKPVEISDMFLDIGADSRDHAIELGAKPGLPIVPICPFTPLAGGKKIMAKAWDNRFGVGLAIELAQRLHNSGQTGTGHPNIVYTGATAQEEVGLRGAQTAAALIDPDLCFTLDAGPAGDTTNDRNAFGYLGKGTLIRLLDREMVPNRALIEFILDTAETYRIPYQYFTSPGATDAGKVQLHGIGVPTAVISLCARYIHTSAALIHTDDYEASKELLIKLIETADWSLLRTITDLP